MCDQQSLRSACAYAQSDQSLCWSLEYFMIVKLLTEHHLEFLSLNGGCRGSSESTLVKMSNCWKSHAAAHVIWISYPLPKGSGTLFLVWTPQASKWHFLVCKTSHELVGELKTHLRRYNTVVHCMMMN